MSQSSPEGIILGKGSKLVSLNLSINKEKVLEIKEVEKIKKIFITPEEIRKTQISYKESKQETLEEAIDGYVYKTHSSQSLYEIISNAIKFGVKWQQKRVYTEEEVRELFSQYKEEFSIYRNMQILNVQFEEWFENFKKK